MEMERFLLDLSIVVGAAAILAWLSLLARQPIIVGYLLCGVLVGPLIEDKQFVDQIGRIGVTLLLFLAGIVLHPRKLVSLFRQTTLVTFGMCSVSFGMAALFAALLRFPAKECVLVGLALMFSSTILVVKLLPTTTLHHRHMGAVCIAILIAEDLVAVALLVFMSSSSASLGVRLLLMPVYGVALVAIALVLEQFVLRKMMRQSDRLHEALYLLALGWCLGVATLAAKMGFSYEIGAFIAGVAMARNPLALFLSEGLKLFRDFFLVLFFFVLGANLDLLVARAVLLPAMGLGAMLLVVKPVLFRALFQAVGETKEFGREAGIRLGQASEFSLVIAVFALKAGVLSEHASQLVQLATITTMVVSSYLVVVKLPTPLGTRKGLQRD